MYPRLDAIDSVNFVAMQQESRTQENGRIIEKSDPRMTKLARYLNYVHVHTHRCVVFPPSLETWLPTSLLLLFLFGISEPQKDAILKKKWTDLQDSIALTASPSLLPFIDLLKTATFHELSYLHFQSAYKILLFVAGKGRTYLFGIHTKPQRADQSCLRANSHQLPKVVEHAEVKI